MIKIIKESRAIDRIYGFRPALANVERELRKFNKLYRDMPQVSFDPPGNVKVKDMITANRWSEHIGPEMPDQPIGQVKPIKKRTETTDNDPPRPSTQNLPPAGY